MNAKYLTAPSNVNHHEKTIESGLLFQGYYVATELTTEAAELCWQHNGTQPNLNFCSRYVTYTYCYRLVYDVCNHNL